MASGYCLVAIGKIVEDRLGAGTMAGVAREQRALSKIVSLLWFCLAQTGDAGTVQRWA